MARVHGRGDGCAKINVTEAEHKIAGPEHDILHCLLVLKAVDAANELDIGRAPGRIRAHEVLVFADSKVCAFVIPGQGHVNGARRHRYLVHRRQAGDRFGEQSAHFCEGEARGVDVNLQRTNAGGQVDQPFGLFGPEPFH